jgi:hypothetical protein
MATPGATVRAVASAGLASEVRAGAAALAWSPAAAEGAAVDRAKAGMASVVNANAATPRHRVLKVGPDHLKPLILVLS